MGINPGPPVCSARSLALSKLPCGSFCAPSFCSMILCRTGCGSQAISPGPRLVRFGHIRPYAPLPSSRHPKFLHRNPLPGSFFPKMISGGLRTPCSSCVRSHTELLPCGSSCPPNFLHHDTDFRCLGNSAEMIQLTSKKPALPKKVGLFFLIILHRKVSSSHKIYISMPGWFIFPSTFFFTVT